MMEKKRSPIVPIVLALGIGLLTILLLNSVISPTPVVVARVAIAPGTILTADLLEVRTLPAGGRPADAFGKIAEVQGEMLAVGRAPGDPITAAVLGDNSSAGIPALLEPGHVAMAVQVDLASGVAGLLRPGQTVTVIGLLTPEVLSSQAGLARVITSPVIVESGVIVEDGGPTATPTATATPEPPLGPVGRIAISGIRVLMVPQSFQYQEIPAGASQQELFASSHATTKEQGVVVLDVPTAPLEVAPGVYVNPATLIAVLDRFGGVYLVLEPADGLQLARADILTLNLAGWYQSIHGRNQLNLPTATATVKPPVVSTHTPTPAWQP